MFEPENLSSVYMWVALIRRGGGEVDVCESIDYLPELGERERVEGFL